MKDILPLDHIADSLQDMKLSVVGKRSGLSFPTLKKLQLGEETDYSMKTLRKISAYLLSRNSTETIDLTTGTPRDTYVEPPEIRAHEPEEQVQESIPQEVRQIEPSPELPVLGDEDKGGQYDE